MIVHLEKTIKILNSTYEYMYYKNYSCSGLFIYDIVLQ